MGRKEQLGEIALLVASSLFFASAASADCDLSTYDRTPPAAIRSGLDNGIAHFEWATDVDTVNGRNWIWHYIKNLHSDRGLGYQWPKADLRRSLGSPLDPGKTDCNRYFVTTQTAPDDNAPITYGTNESRQRAAVYAEAKAAAPGPGPGTEGGNRGQPAGPADTPAVPATGSIIETTYTTNAGSSESVRVAISTRQTNADGQWLFEIDRTPNVIVAIAMMKFFNSDQLKSLVAQFLQQSIRVDVGNLRKTIDRDDKEVPFKFLFRKRALGAVRSTVFCIAWRRSRSQGVNLLISTRSAAGFDRRDFV
jgi:hypothetical protein